MPSTSPAQARLMAACAHGAGYAACPPMSVAVEFNQADAKKANRFKVAQALLHQRHQGRIGPASPHSR